MRWFFTYFGINGTLLNAWVKQTIYNQLRMSLDGVCDATWGWGWIGPTWGTFLSWSWYQHTLIRTTVLPVNVNDPILLNGGKKRLNTTINWYRRTFFYQWMMVTDQCGSLQHQIRLYFFITKSADMDGDRWGWRDRANNNKQKNTYHGYDKWEGFKVLIAMIGSA